MVDMRAPLDREARFGPRRYYSLDERTRQRWSGGYALRGLVCVGTMSVLVKSCKSGIPFLDRTSLTLTSTARGYGNRKRGFLPPGEPPHPVPTRFDNDKRASELFLAVGIQDHLKLGMYGFLGRGQDAKADDACIQRLHKDQVAEIPVTRDKNTASLLSNSQDLLVTGLRQTDSRNRDNIVPSR